MAIQPIRQAITQRAHPSAATSSDRFRAVAYRIHCVDGGAQIGQFCMSDRSLSSPPACRQKTAAGGGGAAAAARRISATVRSVKPWIAGGAFARRLHARHHRTDATAVQRGQRHRPSRHRVAGQPHRRAGP
jgi:hypothetical protein